MADVVIRAKAIQSTPAGYQVPGAQEILVRSVKADIDGSGAGGDFLPTLQLLAPDGSVVWEAPTDNPVTAGESATVSWFPRVGAAASGALYPADTVFHFEFVIPAASTSIPAPDGGITFDGPTAFNAQSAFAVVGSPDFNDIMLTKPGMYFYALEWFAYSDNSLSAPATNPQDVQVNNRDDISAGPNGNRATDPNAQGLLAASGRYDGSSDMRWEFTNSDPTNDAYFYGNMPIWRADPLPPTG